MEYFETIKYNDYLYQIRDKMNVLTTLIIGNNKALLIDTGYGFYDLKEYVEGITNKELIVVDSHGHMDHTGGNFRFEKVLINEADYDLCILHNSLERRKRSIDNAFTQGVINNDYDINYYLNQSYGNLEFISVGEKIDLGGIVVEIIDLKGHTKGSIGFFSIELKILVTSDAICPFVWLFLNESLPIKDYIETLKRALKLDFDYFLVGHDARLFKKEEMQNYLALALDTKLDKSFKVDFGDFGDAYCYTYGKLYGNGDYGIIFSLEKNR